MRVIKLSFHLISTPLANIINLSLLKGIFTDKLKIGRVILIYNTEDPSIFLNYRPISLLPNFAKSLKRSFTIAQSNFQKEARYSFSVSLVFVKIPRHHVLLHLLVKSCMQLTNMKPLQVSFWIFLKRLIPSIMNSYLRGYLNFERAFELGSELQ